MCVTTSWSYWLLHDCCVSAFQKQEIDGRVRNTELNYEAHDAPAILYKFNNSAASANAPEFQRNRTIRSGVIAIQIMSNLGAVRHLGFDSK